MLSHANMSAPAQYQVFDRYIDALLSTSNAPHSAMKWLEQSQRLAAAFTATPEFDRAMTDPRVKTAQKEAVVAAIAARLGLDETLKRTLLLLVRKGRGTSLGGFAARLVTRLKAQSGVVVASVTAAKELTPAQSQELSRSLGDNVELNTQIDPEILGGLIVQIGSWRMDDSVKGKLDRLVRRLAKAA